MNIVRIYLVVLMAGWFAWLALDTAGNSAGDGPLPPYGGRGGGAPYALPLPERPLARPVPPPPPQGDAVADYRYAADMIRRGEYRQGFIVLWPRQYWTAAAIVSAIWFVAGPPLVAALRRRRKERRRSMDS